MEIEVEFGTMLEMADRTMLAKYLIKNLAFQEGKTVTFMPKPLYGEAGNGLHVHMHMFKDGQPLFFDENGYSNLSETALNFIGGVLKHAPALLAFTNPSTNSYKRLVPGYEAPVNCVFATSNPRAVIRIPPMPRIGAKRFGSGSLIAPAILSGLAAICAGLDDTTRSIHQGGVRSYDVTLHPPAEELAR